MERQRKLPWGKDNLQVPSSWDAKQTSTSSIQGIQDGFMNPENEWEFPRARNFNWLRKMWMKERNKEAIASEGE